MNKKDTLFLNLLKEKRLKVSIKDIISLGFSESFAVNFIINLSEKRLNNLLDKF